MWPAQWVVICHLGEKKIHFFFAFGTKVVLSVGLRKPGQGCFTFDLNASTDVGTQQLSAITNISIVLAPIYKLLHLQISIKLTDLLRLFDCKSQNICVGETIY